jgi:hypothetical protein
VTVGPVSLAGFPDVAALWLIGLGLIAAVLATLSMITRRNSRHPLLLVGLVALGITLLSWRVVPQAIESRARIRSQAVSIVDHTPAEPVPRAVVGSGIYLGLAAAAVLTAFGLTIVVKRASTAYAIVDPNDDV